MTATWRAVVGMVLVAALGACGDSGTEPVNDDGNNNGGGGNNGGIVVKDDPSFAADIMGVFSRNGCASGGCHDASAQGGLDLRAGQAYLNLVGVAAVGESGTRVIPNNANGSYLVIKLEGRQTFGERMPKGRSALGTTDLTNIKNWINKGAREN